ncbi:hypothetical protein EDC96DRAFT_546530 [Choanephora cucurbitarum]|nr:hypothetical protein EDC96DRAFT_546530 [Choanephora cucurbitarum]
MTNTKDSNAVSPSFRSLLSVSPVYEPSMCFQRQDESKIECKHKESLYKSRQNSRCVNFESNLISEKSIPEFLFIIDSTNFDPKFVDHKSELKEYDCQAYFPDTFSINVPAVQRPQKPRYTLHVRAFLLAEIRFRRTKMSKNEQKSGFQRITIIPSLQINNLLA